MGKASCIARVTNSVLVLVPGGGGKQFVKTSHGPDLWLWLQQAGNKVTSPEAAAHTTTLPIVLLGTVAIITLTVTPHDV